MSSHNRFKFQQKNVILDIPHYPQTTEERILLLLAQMLGEGHILPTHRRLRDQNQELVGHAN